MNSKIKIWSMILLAGMSLTMACETERRIFEGPYFVRFTDPAVTEKESHSQVIQIEVHNSSAEPAGNVTINYTIGGSAREGIDYTIKGTRGKVVIKSGEYFGTIQLQIINNANNILRTQDVVLTLQTIDNNDNNLRIGQGVSQIGKTFTLTIQDDCILGGNYYGLSAPTSVPIEEITITSFNCEEYTLSNWDIDIFQFAEVRDLTFIDNGDNTLTIPEQEEATLGTSIDGSGVVNPTTRVITFTIRFVELDEQPKFTFDLIPN
ncbi:MAG TPA: hypothetical protein VK508_03280 [Cyclobacteriaceae bacterium]|nr:hypothetical protein [Cyclobacteriaceae bacterium]